jgi:periplasmic divalent cation tolerance protein
MAGNVSEVIRIALTTLPDRESAERIGADVVARGMAACAQVEGPLSSHYLWEGKPCHAEEWRLVLKTDAPRENALRERIHALHPHRVPQWLVLGAGASEAYLAWVQSSSH